jgi:type VI secretion system protein ImpF
MEIHVRAPLFDRLTDLDPESAGELRPMRTLNRTGLRESIRRELGRLLNTRSSIPVDELAQRPELTVLEYGIPDLSAYSAGDDGHQRLLAGILARVITAFEPRLREVRVSVVRLEDEQRSLRLRIDAVLTADEVARPVSFPALMGLKSGQVEIQEEETPEVPEVTALAR